MLKKLFVLTLVLSVLLSGSFATFAAEYDLGGKTVNYVTFVYFMFEEDPGVQERVALAEEKFNCKINIVKSAWGEEEQDQIQRLLAGESQYDIWRVDSSRLFKMAAQDQLYPIGDVMSDAYLNTLPEISRSMIEGTDYNGRIYGMGTSDWNTQIDGMYFIQYNADMFAEAGLPDPYEQFQEGTWTWEAFEKALRTVTKDTNGDGENDQWGIDILSTGPFVISNGVKFAEVNEDGKVVYNGDDERVIDAIAKKAEWRQKGYMAGWGDFFIQGTSAMLDAPLWQGRKKHEVADFNMGLVPYPMGPAANDYSYPMFAFNCYALPANSAAPEALMAIHDTIWPPSTARDRFTEEVMTWFPNREMYSLTMKATRQWNPDYLLNYMSYLGIDDDMEAVFNGEANAASTMNSVKPKAQTNLDELFNN
ncbi:MAG: ABC transporter substrate-binding protein [Halanaerobiales bacterium]